MNLSDEDFIARAEQIIKEDKPDKEQWWKDSDIKAFTNKKATKEELENIIIKDGQNNVNKVGHGMTPLGHAIKSGAIHNALFFIQNGANINTFISKTDGKCALSYACSEKNEEIVSLLMSKNAKRYIPDKNDKYPINYCDKTFARKLINFGEEIKPRTKNILEAAKQDLTKEVLHWIVNGNDINTMENEKCILDHCAHNGNLYLVHLLINLGANLHRTDRDAYKFNLVHFAVNNNKINVLKLLYQMNINLDLWNPLESGNYTPLMLAIVQNNIEIADFLMHRTEWKKYLSKENLDAFQMAIQYDRKEIVEMFVRDFNLLNSKLDGMDLLMYSVRWNAVNCMYMFLQNFAKDEVVNGESPATIAAKYGSVNALQYLLSIGVNVNTVNSNNESLIMIAIKNQQIHVANLLIQSNCDLRIMNRSNESVFSTAVDYKLYDVLADIVQRVDQPILFDLRRAALYQAFSNNDTKAAKILLESIKANNEIPNDRLLRKSNSKEMNMVILGIKSEKEVKKKNKTIHIAAAKNDLNSVKYFLLQNAKSLDSRDENKKTPIMHAAENNAVEVLLELIFYGANMNMQTEDGTDALSFAAKKDNLECFTILHQRGVPINELRTDNMTPICIAAKHGSLDVLNYIISQGVHPATRIHPADFPIAYAILKGNLKVVQHLIEECGCDKNMRNKDEIPILYLSVNQEKVFNYLIERGVDKTQEDRDGGTLVHYAAKANDLMPLKHCVENGISLTTPRRSDGFISMHIACLAGLLPNIEYLYNNKVDINTFAMNDILPIHCVIQSKNIKAINFVINWGGKLGVHDAFGLTPIMYCCKFGVYEIFKKMLDDDVCINLKDISGYDPFYLACYGGNVKIVKLLFKRDKKMDINKRYLSNYTYLHAACEQGNMDIVEFLIGKKASMELRTDDNSLPIHLAAKNNHLKIVQYLVKKFKSDKQLLKEKGPFENTCLQLALYHNALDVAAHCLQKGADPYSVNSSNLPILHHAAYQGDILLMRRILKFSQFDINNNFNYETPLTMSLRADQYEMAVFLINHNADMYAKETCRPLHRAVFENKLERVKRIIDIGFNPNELSDDRVTPFMIALRDNNPVMINYFMTLNLDINVTDYQGATALAYAIKLGQTLLVKEMINRGYCISYQYADLTPLNASIRYDFPDIFRLLLDRGADVNLAAYNGFYPEMEAAISPNIFYLQFMSNDRNKFKFNAGSKMDKSTPLMHAMLAKRMENFKFLLNSGADVNICSMDKMTPIFIAILNCRWEYAEILHQKNPEAIKVRNEFDFKPLRYCTRYQRLMGLEFCIKHGENINQYIENIPLVFYGVNDSGWKAAEKLRQLGADIMADGELKQSLLHHVAKYYYLNDIVDFARILLGEGLNINYKDEKGYTPLYYTQWELSSAKGNRRNLALPSFFKQNGGTDSKFLADMQRIDRDIDTKTEIRNSYVPEYNETIVALREARALANEYYNKYSSAKEEVNKMVSKYNDKVKSWNEQILKSEGKPAFYSWHQIAQSYRSDRIDSLSSDANSYYSSFIQYQSKADALQKVANELERKINALDSEIAKLKEEFNTRMGYWEKL